MLVNLLSVYKYENMNALYSKTECIVKQIFSAFIISLVIYILALNYKYIIFRKMIH